jgi:hypothetical protein
LGSILCSASVGASRSLRLPYALITFLNSSLRQFVASNVSIPAQLKNRVLVTQFYLAWILVSNFKKNVRVESLQTSIRLLSPVDISPSTQYVSFFLAAG